MYIIDATNPSEAEDAVSDIFYEVLTEVRRQDSLWGSDRTQSDPFWSLILGEEVGEVNKAILSRDYHNLREELVQVAAVCGNWIKALDARSGTAKETVQI